MHPSSQRDLLLPHPVDQGAHSQHPAGEDVANERQRAWSYAPSEKEQLKHQGIISEYANCPPLEQHPANYAPLTYAIPPGHQQHATQVYTQPYVSQLYTMMPEQPQHQWNQHIDMTISPQYANGPEQCQNSTPMSPHSYASPPAATQPQNRRQEQRRGIEIPTQQLASYTEPPSSPTSNSPGPLPLKVNPEVPSRSETMPIVPDENPLQSPKSPYFPPPTRTITSHTPQQDDLSVCHQPGQTTHPNQQVEGGGWSSGLCEFSSFGICCLGLFCPCSLYGRTQYRLSMKSRKEDPTNMLGYETCNGSCTGMGLLCGCQWLLATVQHTRMRKAYKIQGSIASDCVRATCCTCCTLIQDEKEIQKREENRSRAVRERNATLLSPYTAPGPMSYGPPPR
ncbi:Uncharacterized protein family Cys-rich [Penicillium digitatum]|uniref:Uncharacterized protein family Cys-rich n=1 Tax=Penicillium digitatum TaxID=36651 RepID=A0A7T6XNA2_PENDI|nr:Uncharacterized protein family Cys-rich [Penicillium digitatum]